MPDLRDELQRCFLGRVCLIGLGNPDHGDDGFGQRLAEALSDPSRTESALDDAVVVIAAGTTPDRWVSRVADAGFDHVIFLDAVEFGSAPGTTLWLDAAAMTSRFPQISTHKISLGTLSKWIELNGKSKAWLLGVQPGSLKASGELSAPVRRVSDLLKELLCEFCAGKLPAAESLLEAGAR